jgi:IrrE N-terminal-like domain
MGWMSVIPAFVPHRQSVEDVAVELPLGHELMHQLHEALVVRRFEQVNHLVDDNIFKTFDRLSGEISIQPNGARVLIAAELLMPAKFLMNDLRGKNLDLLGDSQFLDKLAKKYKVSVQALTFRLANLGYIRL